MYIPVQDPRPPTHTHTQSHTERAGIYTQDISKMNLLWQVKTCTWQHFVIVFFLLIMANLQLSLNIQHGEEEEENRLRPSLYAFPEDDYQV